MNTVSRFKAGLARFRGFAEKAGRDPASIAGGIARAGRTVARGRARTIDGEAEMFTGGAADYVADIKALRELGVSAVDVRLFGARRSMTRSTTCAASATK